MFKAELMTKVNLFLISSDLKKISNILYDLKLIDFFKVKNDDFLKFEHEDLSKETHELLKLRSSISILKSHFTKKTNNILDKPLAQILMLKEKEDKLLLEISILKNNLDLNKDDEISDIKLNSKKKDLKALDIEFKNLANGNLEILQLEELKLSKEIAVLEVRNKFIKSKNVSIMSGFVPSKLIHVLKLALKEEVEGKFELELIKLKEDESIPISLKNGFASDYESLLKMYSLPKYGEFDPTILMFLIFPFFFGFILGDVIYGLISLFIFTLVKKKFSEIKDFLSILQFSSISSIFFGFIFGEFMGFELHGPLWGFFDRFHNPEELLIIALLFGFLHINLGVLIAFINNLNNIRKAICNHASWFILELGLVLLYFGIKNVELVVLFYLGLLGIFLGIFLMYLGHGFIGVIEIPSFFTNIFSYARLMAVGLSSVAIALIINEYAISMASSGIFGAIAGIILFTLGHIFNIVLGNFEGFIHTLRLHYVEFFTKFYSGDGREFVAFGERVHDKLD